MGAVRKGMVQKGKMRKWAVRGVAIALMTAASTLGINPLGINSLGNVALAGDPFRSSDPHDIGDRTEEAFEALFIEGNYPAANEAIQKAVKEEPGEPCSSISKAPSA